MNQNELQFILKMRDEATAVLRQHGLGARSAGNDLKGMGDSGKKAADSMKSLVSAARDATTAIAGLYASNKMLKGSSEAFADWDAGLRRVASIAGMSQQELRSFGDEFRKLNEDIKSIPTDQLFAMEATLSQMGVANKDLASVGNTVAKLADATGIAAENVAESSAVILNLTGEGVGAIKQFGDSLSFLDRNANSTSQQILNLATNIAQGTSQFGLSSKAILALATTSANAKIFPELMRSVPQRALLELQQGAINATAGFRNFLKVAGMTKAQFDVMLKEHPEEVFLRLAEAYKKTVPTGESGTFLKALKIDTVEVNTVLGTLANKAGEARKYLEELDKGEANSDLDKRFAVVNQGQKADMQALLKMWNELKVAVGDAIAPLAVPVLQGLISGAHTLRDLFTSMPGPVRTAVGVIVTIGPAVLGAVSAVRLLNVAFRALGTETGLMTVIRSLGSLPRLTRGATGGVVNMARAFLGLADGASLLGGVQATLGSLLGVIPRIATMGGVFGMIATAVEAVGTALAAIVGWPALIVAAVVAAGVAIYANWEKVRDFLAMSPKEIVASIGHWFATLPEIVGNAFSSVILTVAGVLDSLYQKASASWNAGIKFVFETLPNINWAHLAGEVMAGIYNAIADALNRAGKALKDWWESPLWAKKEIKVDVTPQVDQAKAAAQAKKAAEDAAKQKAGVAGSDGKPTKFGLEGGGTNTIDAEIKKLKDEIEVAKALTGEDKRRAEASSRIQQIAEQTGLAYDEVKAKIGGMITELQNAQRAAAVFDAVRGLKDQVEDARAITAEQKTQAELHKAIAQIEREHGALTAKEKQSLSEQLTQLQQIKQQNAYADQMRSLDQQLADVRAITTEEKTRLEVIKTITDFEKENGKLNEQDRASLAQKIVQLKTIQEFQRLAQQYDPVGTARQQYEQERKTLDVMRQQKVITDAQYARMSQNLDERTRAQRDPIGDRVKNAREELEILRLSTDKQGIERNVLQEVNQLKSQGVVVTEDMTKAIREYVTALDDADKAKKSGFSGFVESVGTLRDNLNDLTKDFASGLSGAISGALSGDKGAFRNALAQFGRKMIDTGVNQLMAQALKGLGVQQPQDAALNRADAALAKLDALGKAGISTPQAIIQAGTVTVNGKELGAQLDAANDNIKTGAIGNAADSTRSFFSVGGQKSSGAVDLASGLLGKKEGSADINSFLKAGGVNIDAAQTAWCAGFVNSALKQIGVDGTGKLNATSFLNWGSKIDPSQVMKGDVLVDANGRNASQTGGHVGFATGNTRMLGNQQQIEMLSGNSADSVRNSWYNAKDLDVRRATEAMGNAQQNPGLQQAQQQLQQVGQTAQQSAQQVQQASTAMQQAGGSVQQLGTSSQQTGMSMQMAGQQVQMGTQQASTAMQQLDTSTQQTGTTAQQCGTQFQQAGQQIQQAGQQAAQGAAAAGGGLAGIGSAASGVTPGLGQFAGGIAGLMGPLNSVIPGLGSFGNAILQLLTGSLTKGFGGGGGGGGLGSLMSLLPMFALAEGGKITGPGTGTSDSILAKVSNGEFVVNANATRRHGPILQAINDNKLPHFARGGRIGGGSFDLGSREMSRTRGGSASANDDLAAQVASLTQAVGKMARSNHVSRVNQLNMNVTAKDADSFRRSSGQMLADGQLKMARYGSRNN